MINKQSHFLNPKKNNSKIKNNYWLFRTIPFSTHGQNYLANGMVFVLTNTKMSTYFGLSDILPTSSQNIFTKSNKRQSSWRLTTHQKSFGKESKKPNKILTLQWWTLPGIKQYIEAEEHDRLMVAQSQKREKGVDKKSTDKECISSHKI